MGGLIVYERLNKILDGHDFDRFVETRCRAFYAAKMSRASLAPAVYFRLLLIGYFEGIDSERGIAWRVADSMALRRFVGHALTDSTADHSTISRARRSIDLPTHQEVFVWVLQLLAREKLLDGKTLGVDATTLEANAAVPVVYSVPLCQQRTYRLTPSLPRLSSSARNRACRRL